MRYKVGMYGGSFSPLHNGHVDCVIQAANMCEKLFIVLSVGSRRDEISARVRYRWLYQLTRHIGNVKILTINDDAESKEQYTKACWEADARRVKELIGEPIDVVFCGSDYDENSFWSVCYPESRLHIFPRNGISSTAIRADVYAHWEELPEVVRPYYVKKVLIIGGESTGKSTLTINLAHRFCTNYVDEAGRELSERSGTDALMLPQDFTEILLQQKLNEMRAAERSNKLLFIDTDALVTQFYMLFLEDEGARRNIPLSDAIDALNEYDLILFLEPDVPFVQDGDRSTVIERDRERYSRQIKELLSSHGKEFVSVSGDYQQRYEAAVERVSALLRKPCEK